MQNSHPVDEQALKASGIIGARQQKPKRVGVKTVQQGGGTTNIHGGDFNDVMRVTGDVLSSGARIAAHAAPLLLGLGKKKKAKQPLEWNTLVAKLRQET